MSEKINVVLNPDIIYVTGTCNGAEAVFTYQGESSWEAAVPRSWNDRYELDLYAYNIFGAGENVKLTLYYGWIECVYDRTLADVIYARDHPDSKEPLKGARNYTDFHRITSNIHSLQRLLAEYGFDIAVNCKTDWRMGETAPRHEVQKILDDINALRGVFFVYETTPATPELPLNTYQKLNDIEKILDDMHNAAMNIKLGRRYAGSFYSGGI